MPDGGQTQTCTWTGYSGTKYQYGIYPIGTSFVADPGNYIYAKLSGPGLWSAVYIGEAEDLSTRFDNHHAATCIGRNGATHIHVHLSSANRQVRLNEETDLRRSHSTPCNKQ